MMAVYQDFHSALLARTVEFRDHHFMTHIVMSTLDLILEGTTSLSRDTATGINPPVSTVAHECLRGGIKNIDPYVQRFLNGADRQVMVRYKEISSLPTDTPISQHMNTLVANDGIAPQIEVAMKRIVERSMEYFRPTLSAIIPHTIDPMTVPDIAIVGSNAPAVFVRPYSFSRPGIINPIVAGFMISTVMARVSTADSFVCAGVQSALWRSSKYAVLTGD